LPATDKRGVQYHMKRLIVICSWLVAALVAQATDFVWTNTANSTGVSSGLSWTNGVAPTSPGTYTDNFIITNNLNAANRTAILDAAYNLAGFIATNTGTFVRTIVLNNNLTLAVNGTSLIGSNTILNLGSNTIGGSTFSNNNLFLQDNAQIVFNSSGTLNAGTLFVGGNFTNTTQSVISGTGAAVLQFASAAITNAGTMSFVLGANGALGNQMLTITAGSDSNAFFANSGTLTLGFGTVNITTRNFVFSNQFFNTATGFLVITNAQITAGAGSAPNVIFTGSTRATGGASTNAGTIRFVRTVAPAGNPAQAAGTLTFLNGDFVNHGTLTVNQASNTTAALILAEAGSVFSNATGGQIVLEPSGTGSFAVRADYSVNLGSNVLNAGALVYQGRSGGSTFVDNAGTIVFAGGSLGVFGTLTNQVGGVMLGTFTNANAGGGLNFVNLGTMQNSNLFNAGILNSATGVGNIVNLSGGLINLAVGTPTMALVTNAGTVVAMGGSTNQINTFVWNSGTIIVSNVTTVLSLANGAFNAGVIAVHATNVLNIGGVNQATANASTFTFTNAPGGTVVLGLAPNLGLLGGTLNASTNGIGFLNQGILTTASGNHSGNSVVNAAVINAAGGTIKTTAGTESISIYSMATNFGLIFIPAVNEAITVQNGGMFNSGIITIGNGGSVSVAGTVINSGTITLAGGRPAFYTPLLFNQTNGYVTLTQNFNSTANQMPTLGAAITNAGVIILTRLNTQTLGGNYTPDLGFVGLNPTWIPNIDNTGTLILSGNGALINAAIVLSSLDGTITNGPTGYIIASNNVVTALRGLAKNQGTIQVETDSVFSTTYNTRSAIAGKGNPGNWDVGTGGFTNDGVVLLKSGYLAATVFSNAAGAQLSGAGTIGRVTFSNNWDLAGAFGFVVTPGFIVNAGTIAPTGVFNAGNITNLSGGLIIGNGTIQSLMSTNLNNGTNSFNFGGRIVNLAGGTVLASGGTLVLSNGFSAQNGTIGANFGSVLQLGDGTLALTNNGTVALTGGELRAGNIVNNGSLRGNGLVRGDVTSFGTNSPGFSVGTLSITGSLTLASTAVTWMELAGNGSNDLLVVSGALQYGGQLIVTNITGFTFAAGQSFQLFQFGLGNQSGDFAATNLPDLLNGTLVWDTAHLNDQGILSIAVIPEPSALALVGLGLVGLLIVRRHRR